VHKAREPWEEFKAKLKAGFKTLDMLYLLTDKHSVWLDCLKADGWYTIMTTWDLVLDLEQAEVNMMVDMKIARRAAIFISNGVHCIRSGLIRPLVDD